MLNPIDISKGTFKTQSDRSLRNSPYAENLINLFIDDAGSNYDRPALDAFVTLDSIIPIGMYYFSGRFIVVTRDRNIFTINPSGSVEDITGTALPGSDRPSFADDGTTLYIAGGGTPIKWQGPGYTTLGLGGSPPSFTHIVYLDGYLMGNRRLASENNKVMQFAEFEDTETWTSTNIFSAVADPDELQGLAIAQRELYAVGADTTEIWQNLGTSPVPFGRAFIWQFGTIAPQSILQVNNSVAILDQSRRILQMSGREYARISEAIEDDISKYTEVSDCVSGSFEWKGHIHMLFIFPSAGKAWSMDIKNQQWTEWRGYDTGVGVPRINCVYYSPQDQMIIAGDILTGQIWRFSSTEKTDGGTIFERRRTFSHRDAGLSVRKRVDLLRINMNRNIASSYTGTTSDTNPTIEIRWKDDGKPWSDWRQKSVGEIGENKYYVEFRRLGIYRTRKYEIRMTDPAELNIAGIETDEIAMVS